MEKSNNVLSFQEVEARARKKARREMWKRRLNRIAHGVCMIPFGVVVMALMALSVTSLVNYGALDGAATWLLVAVFVLAICGVCALAKLTAKWWDEEIAPCVAEGTERVTEIDTAAVIVITVVACVVSVVVAGLLEDCGVNVSLFNLGSRIVVWASFVLTAVVTAGLALKYWGRRFLSWTRGFVQGVRMGVRELKRFHDETGDWRLAWQKLWDEYEMD